MNSQKERAGASRFWVTCYTDASFTPIAAGWGVWLRSTRGRIVRHGACPPYVSSANEAELAAIFAGVYLARKVWGDAVRGLVVYTDSQAAVRFLSDEALKPRIQRNAPAVARLRERIRTFSNEHGIELDLRWVKGHQRTNTVRAYLNARCDQLAGAARAVAQRSEKRTVAEKRGREAGSAVAEKSNGTPNAGKPGVERLPRRSSKQKNRERRHRARERNRAKKVASVSDRARPRAFELPVASGLDIGLGGQCARNRARSKSDDDERAEQAVASGALPNFAPFSRAMRR
ncbi:ribonuclease H family protein [Sorangium cellulosum]|uniref:ribonuclease H family protein n=1 Tax=Sorangium cellulosum TaxID=56 RepID=UPI0009B8D229|nr:ribonuclease H family protein [Sorangium cellulosum]